MDNTNRSKLKWSRISYVVLTVIVASTILGSLAEHKAYAGGSWKYSAEYTLNQFFVVVFMPLVLGSGLLLIAIVARRSFPVTIDN